jgi:hypothetical protein
VNLDLAVVFVGAATFVLLNMPVLSVVEHLASKVHAPTIRTRQCLVPSA